MRKIHVAISTDDIAATVDDYSRRLDCPPCVIVPGEYALWRTDTVNLSVRRDRAASLGSLRHLGWEDPAAKALSTDTDINGIVWEQFSADEQTEKIEAQWPGTKYATS